MTIVETQVTVTGPGASQLVVKANSARVLLILAAYQAQNIFISTKSQTSGQQGLVLQSTTLPLHMNADDHPGLVQHEWYAGAGGAAGLTIIEGILLR